MPRCAAALSPKNSKTIFHRPRCRCHEGTRAPVNGEKNAQTSFTIAARLRAMCESTRSPVRSPRSAGGSPAISWDLVTPPSAQPRRLQAPSAPARERIRTATDQPPTSIFFGHLGQVAHRASSDAHEKRAEPRLEARAYSVLERARSQINQNSSARQGEVALSRAVAVSQASEEAQKLTLRSPMRTRWCWPWPSHRPRRSSAATRCGA